ncbi:MAG: pyruvate kinase [Lachnospiraceae bacterium]|nr:pyruvate kinase [Lachnospiraceae bacterium]
MDYRRKTKIICTLGPSSEGEEVMRQVMLAGMNVGRFNFSHGDHEEQRRKLETFKKLRRELQLPVAALLDTKGPEIRLRDFEEDRKYFLEKGQEFTLTTDQSVVGDQTKVAISYEELTNDVQAGSHILIDDGLVELLVKEVKGKDIVCEVLNGGKVSNKKGVNVPNVDLTMEFISPKDKGDLIFACENDMDFVAASFTRTAQDIKDVRAILDANGGERIQIIAKIESMQGIDNIDEIIEVADGIMVARGDMGVEIPMEEVPVIQKMIIKKVYQAGKYVITATQMLDSMMNNPRPTRAEATDVANAIYDGTSAIMLSGETANGDYPVEAVKTMATIAARTEQDINYANRLRQRDVEENPTITDAVSHSACTMADDLSASAICTVTKSGRTAHYVAKYRPTAPIIAGSMSRKVYRQMAIEWGVIPILIDEQHEAQDLIDHVVERAEEEKLVAKGDTVVITAGVPVGVSGMTNLIKATVVE